VSRFSDPDAGSHVCEPCDCLLIPHSHFEHKKCAKFTRVPRLARTLFSGEAVFPQCGILGVTPSFVHRECRGHSTSWHCSPLSDDAMDDAQKALPSHGVQRSWNCLS